MSGTQKLLEKLRSKSGNFTWDEAVTLLSRLGYKIIKKSGSRRRFVHKDSKQVISLHEPHPQKEMRDYQVNYLIEQLSTYEDK